MNSTLRGLATIHGGDAIHRDIKPSNILLKASGIVGEPPIVRIIDFGSAVDDYTLHTLYMNEPSQNEQTLDYAPPEVLFSHLPYNELVPESYDVWSVGVLFLELILGTSVVFEIDGRTKALLERKLRNRSKGYKQRMYFLQALSEYCFHVSDNDSCPLEKTMDSIQRRDPLKQKFSDKWAALLLRRLLAYNPHERISVQAALTHAYFTGPWKDGDLEFEFEYELKEHLERTKPPLGLPPPLEFTTWMAGR